MRCRDLWCSGCQAGGRVAASGFDRAVADEVCVGVVIAAVHGARARAVQVQGSGRAGAWVGDAVNAPGVRQQLGLLTRAPDGAPVAAEVGLCWLGFVVQADVAVLQQRTGDANVHAPAGVIVNWSPDSSGPEEQLEVYPVGRVVQLDVDRRWTFDAGQVIQQIAGPDQCCEQRSCLAHGHFRREVRQGPELL